MSAFSFGFNANAIVTHAPTLPESPGANPVRPVVQRLYHRGDTVFEAGQTAQLWRVVSGVMALVQREHDAQHFMSLAMPGDLLGIEALCQVVPPLPHRLRAEALTEVELVSLVPTNQGERQQLMVAALLQQQQRSHDMAHLRTGPVVPRVAALLKVLGHAAALVGEPQNPDTLRKSLPALRDLALVVDAKPETVCRALTQLLPPRTRKPGPRPWVNAGAGACTSARAAVQALGFVGHARVRAEGALA